jgi:4,5-dihydroxyphthalate decarboxylase
MTSGTHQPRDNSQAKLTLTASLRTFGYTEALKNGDVTVKDAELEFVEVQPQIAAFRRMVREVAFDICELAPTTYIIARAHGAPFKALPIFFGRKFHHSGLLVRPDANVKVPKDLEGKQVGVRAYSVTTGVWTRGILENEYGLDTSKVTWVVDDEEHVRELVLPPNVIHVADGKSLASMIATGEIQAGFDANAGIGREGPPAEDWGTKVKLERPELHELIPNAAAEEAQWFKRTGIFPVHGTLVVKDAVLDANPDFARHLFDAFVEAKEAYLVRLRSGDLTSKKDKELIEAMKIVGDDPLPYGLEQNRPTLEALIDYAYQQKLIPRRSSVEELFVKL